MPTSVPKCPLPPPLPLNLTTRIVYIIVYMGTEANKQYSEKKKNLPKVESL